MFCASLSSSRGTYQSQMNQLMFQFYLLNQQYFGFIFLFTMIVSSTYHKKWEHEQQQDKYYPIWDLRGALSIYLLLVSSYYCGGLIPEIYNYVNRYVAGLFHVILTQAFYLVQKQPPHYSLSSANAVALKQPNNFFLCKQYVGIYVMQ